MSVHFTIVQCPTLLSVNSFDFCQYSWHVFASSISVVSISVLLSIDIGKIKIQNTIKLNSKPLTRKTRKKLVQTTESGEYRKEPFTFQARTFVRSPWREILEIATITWASEATSYVAKAFINLYHTYSTTVKKRALEEDKLHSDSKPATGHGQSHFEDIPSKIQCLWGNQRNPFIRMSSTNCYSFCFTG